MGLSVMGGAVGQAPGEWQLVRGHLDVWRRFARQSLVMSRQSLTRGPKLGPSRNVSTVTGQTQPVQLTSAGVKRRCAAMPHHGDSGREARRLAHESEKGSRLGEPR
jgi:hypothetical protein